MDMSEEEAFAHELMLERERMAREAIQRVAKAGAKAEDIKTLCRECGVSITEVTITEARHG